MKNTISSVNLNKGVIKNSNPNFSLIKNNPKNNSRTVSLSPSAKKFLNNHKIIVIQGNCDYKSVKEKINKLQKEIKRTQEKPEGLIKSKEIKNFAKVYPFLYRGGRPTEEGIKELSKIGVSSIVNLESDILNTNFNKDKEEALAQNLGMKYMSIPVIPAPVNLVFKNKLKKAVDFIKKPENHPVFVHCIHGRDRTGIVLAAYRIIEDEWPVDKAIKEMESFGFKDIYNPWKKLLYGLKDK